MPGVCNTTGKGPYRHSPGVWKGAIAVALGDFVFRDVADGYDKPISSFTWDTNEATTLAAVHDVFRGVSQARRTTAMTLDGGRNGDGGMVLCSGEFEYPCVALGSAAKVGNLVTFVKDTGNTLLPAQVVVTSTVAAAIGIVTEDAPVGATFLKFEIHPVIWDRGVQAIQ